MAAQGIQAALYPQFAIVKCGEQQFVSERQAVEMLAESPRIPCQLGALVRDVDGERAITADERKGIMDLVKELEQQT